MADTHFGRLLARGVVALIVGASALAPLSFITSGFASAAPTVQTVANTEAVGSIACWTATNCVAVGEENVNQPVIVPITNGIPGTAQIVPVQANSGASLTGVACEPTTTTCIAVGESDGGTVQPLVVQIVNGTAGSPESLTNDSYGLNDIACTSSTACVAVGSTPFVSYSSPAPGVVVPLTNGTPGPAEEVSDGGLGDVIFDGIACMSAAECVATAVDQVPYENQGQLSLESFGADVVISGATPGSLILDQDLEGIWRGTCPTSTSCLFASNNNAGASSLVSIDAAGSPSTPQTVPGAGQRPEDVVCPLSSSACGFTSSGVSGGMPTSYIAPVSNGVPGASVAVQGGFTLLRVACPTTTSCLAGAYKGEGPTAVGAVATLSPPTTSVTVPSNNATVSGSQVLDAGASDAIGVTQVQYEITGGSLSHTIVGTGSASIYGWLASWNSTTVANGTYALQSVATDAEGLVTASAPITITVNNTPPPTTSVVIPSNNATVTGTQLLGATASSGVTQVKFEITGGVYSDAVIATASGTLYGWLANWNTTTVANGTYTLQSVATGAGGVNGTSPGITVTVHN
jgi:hypothetical protein